ncbi:MAG: hypothetical protein HY900_29600 [Deltaproteobacteria bacterium]|nr:hypothetical protein [Deltaproteobacteria bacterium]
MGKCPGQDTQQWGFDAIFDVECPKCHTALEFFRDEVKHRCKRCGEVVFNDRMDLGCAKWCPSAASCVGVENVKALEDVEQRRARREDLRMLLESVPEEQTAVKELFKTLYSEYPGEDRLFDTNRLYTVQEKDPGLFEAATTAFRAFLADKAAIAEREARSRARTEEMLKHDQSRRPAKTAPAAENRP